MKRKTILLIISFVLLGFVSLFAQETISTSGGDASGSGGSVSYTVGQINYTTNSNGNGSVLQGVQQPFEIQIVLGVEVEEIQLTLAVYPNPTTDFLNLKIKNFGDSEMRYQLYDVLGKQLIQQKVNTENNRIDLRHLPIATYLLRVSDTNKVIKIFKIIKR